MGKNPATVFSFWLLVGFLTSTVVQAAQWPVVGQSIENHGSQPAERLIGPQNVGTLVKKWQFDVPTELGLGVSAQPALFGGKLYFTTAADTTSSSGGGAVYAVDARTGDLVWSTQIVGASFASTPAVIGNFVYVAEVRDIPTSVGGILVDPTDILFPSRIFCLRRDTGEIVWAKPLDPSELPSAASPEDKVVPVNKLAYAGDTSVVGNRVMVGVAFLENPFQGDNAARGSVVAFDRFTGEELWRFWTTSDQSLPDPEFGGGVGSWSSPGIDRSRRLAFIGTGQAYECPPGLGGSDPATCPPEPDTFEEGSLTSPFADSLLALNYLTGDLAWHTQFTKDDVWGLNNPTGPDLDVSTHPNIFSIHARLPDDMTRQKHDLVGVGDKAGNYYILKREQDTDTGVILKTLDVDPGGSAGGFQSTPAFDHGVLYMATHAKVEDGARLPTNFFTLATDSHSSKLVAVDVANLLEVLDDVVIIAASIGPNQDTFIKWLEVEDVVADQLFPGLTTGPLTIANGVLYHTSSSGYVRALDAETGIELFRDVPLEVELDLGGGPQEFAVPILGGVTIGNGMIYVGVGSSFFGFPPQLTSALVAYGLP